MLRYWIHSGHRYQMVHVPIHNLTTTEYKPDIQKSSENVSVSRGQVWTRTLDTRLSSLSSIVLHHRDLWHRSRDQAIAERC